MDVGAIIAAGISGLIIGVAYIGIAHWSKRANAKLDKQRETRRLRRLRQQMDSFGDKL